MIAYRTVSGQGKTHRWEDAGDGEMRSRCGLVMPLRFLYVPRYPPTAPSCIKCCYGVCPSTRRVRS